jgi:DNA-3-methyladenine glycosylase II
MRMIDSEAALDDALADLVRLDPELGFVAAEVAAAMGRPRLRKRPPGFPGLVAAVIGQQVSTASAAAMMRRVEERFGAVSPADVAAADDEALRACGLSRAKMVTLRAAADAVISGRCRLDNLGDLPADAAHRMLVGIKGVGPWTADIYLLFCLGHPDAFPAGDLALQEAVRLARGLPARPDARALGAIAERWRPLRGAAATLLWGYYAVRKGRVVGIPEIDPAA